MAANFRTVKFNMNFLKYGHFFVFRIQGTCKWKLNNGFSPLILQRWCLNPCILNHFFWPPSFLLFPSSFLTYMWLAKTTESSPYGTNWAAEPTEFSLCVWIIFCCCFHSHLQELNIHRSYIWARKNSSFLKKWMREKVKVTDFSFADQFSCSVWKNNAMCN